MCRRPLVEDINERESISEDIIAAEGRAQEPARASAFPDAQMRDLEVLLRGSGVEVRPETLTPINLDQYFSYLPVNSTQNDHDRQELFGMYS